MTTAALLVALTLGAAPAQCTTGPTVDGVPVIYCPEQWCYRDGECKLPYSQAPQRNKGKKK